MDINPRTVALGAAGIGALAVFGFLKWKILSGNGKWWAIAIGGLLFAATTPAMTGESNEGL